MGLCGVNGKGILVSTKMIFIHIRSSVPLIHLDDKRFVELPFPIKGMSEIEVGYPELAYGYIGNNQYPVILIIENKNRKGTM
jgi:hypothetical protein